MSRTVVKIETGLIGCVLILAVIFWSFGRASNVSQNSRMKYYGGQLTPNLNKVVHSMRIEMQDISRLLIAEPGCIAFENKDRELLQYRFEYNTLWRNENPVISNIEAFHFEYRDASGYQIYNACDALKNIHSIVFLMRLKNQGQNVYANGRIHIRPYSELNYDRMTRNLSLAAAD